MSRVRLRYDVVALDDLARAVALAEGASGTLAVRSESDPEPDGKTGT